MITIGNFKIGYAPLSMILVLIVSSCVAMLAAFNQFNPQWPMPLSGLIIINECIALAVTLVYGIILHFALYIHRKNDKTREKE